MEFSQLTEQQQALSKKIVKLLTPVYNPLAIYVYGPPDWGIGDEPARVEISVIVEKSYNRRPFDRSFFGNRVLRDSGVRQYLFVYTPTEFDDFAAQGYETTYYAKNYGVKIYKRS